MRVRCPKGRRLVKRALRSLEVLLLVVGVAGVSPSAWLRYEQHSYGERYRKDFERAAEAFRISQPVLQPSASVSRQTAVRSAIPEPAEAPGVRDQGVSVKDTLMLARLLIASIGLDAPVLEGVEDRALRRGAGWIPGTARPGENGNVGIAAHRDTFFRPLGKIRSSDRVELETVPVTQSYVVRSVYVVEPEDTMALRPTREPTLTLVTYFPFDDLGPAPRRYIVQAVADGGPAPSAVDPASFLAAPSHDDEPFDYYG